MKDLRLDDEKVTGKNIPAPSSKILKRNEGSPQFDGAFHYRSVIGKLNYLEKTTRPDISYAVHQWARFVEDPTMEHGKAVRWIGQYLKATKDKGIILKPDGSLFRVHVDADFAGNWDSESAENDADTARSRTGFCITFASLSHNLELEAANRDYVKHH